jgi:quinohemoprotein ethanol dehydrogenase
MPARNVSAAALIGAVLVVAACARPAPPAAATSAASDQTAGSWAQYGRTSDDQRFSPIDQINEKTVGGLGLAWSRELGTTRGLESTPLVKDGVLFVTGSWSVVYAIDARTGVVRWIYDPKVPRERALFICCDVVNRGVALDQGKVYVGTLDGRLVALDEHSGAVVWEVATGEGTLPYAITGAPRVAKGRVIIGNAGAEDGVRGYVSAYDGRTGKRIWRAYTVPGDPSKGFESPAMQSAARTWTGRWWQTGGGGTVWETVAYDPLLDLLYFGTGNPTAWYRGLRGAGDNLYTASILAVHADTGELAWHFQTTPGDNWDFDATQPLVQADLTIGGRARKVILQANKNGYFYVLDRQTGEFISGVAFVDGITWSTGLDPSTGRPIESPAGFHGLDPVLVSPSPDGAHNWQPMAFSPVTGLVYVAAKSGTHMVHAPDPNWKYDADYTNLGLDSSYEGPLRAKLGSLPPATGALLAWDPVLQKAAWRAPYPVTEGGGVLATGGNLVFQGRADGILAAYRATDGKPVWDFDAGTGIMAPPVTYALDGVQYLTVLAGWGGTAGLFNAPGNGPVKPGYGRILTFVLGGKATLDAPPYGHKDPPPTPAQTQFASAQVVHQGALLFGTYCARCHGINAVAGPLPDLRYASAETLAGMQDIVRSGTRAAAGMPSFQKFLNAGQVRAIQAYVASRARESNSPPRPTPGP